MMYDKASRDELIYQMTMSVASQIFENGLISEDEYKQFDTKMMQNTILYSAHYSLILT